MNQLGDDPRRSPMGDLNLPRSGNADARNAAQAVKPAHALRQQLHEMTQQLVRLERQDVTGTNGQPSAIRREEAALRGDISEAQFLIDRLERRYLNGNGHAQPRLSKQPRRSIAPLQRGPRSP